MSETVLSPILNEELIKRALQSYYNKNKTCVIELKSCDFKLSSASGDNFCSKVYQVHVHYEINGSKVKSKSFIVKIMIPEIAELGSNEEIMFNTVLPGMEKCLNYVEGENVNKLHAKCLVSERKKDEFYVLENLNSFGYHCADRLKGLDLEHSLVLMKKIAKFHAGSMIFASKFPEIVASLRRSHFANGASDIIMEAITFGGLKYVAKMIENWPSYDNISQKVYSIIPKFNDLVMEVVKSKNSIFNVINHGDLWVNNFLYKYEEDSGKPIDVLFVDFQNCFWGGCGFDINWILYTSLELKCLKENRQQLIEAYHEALKQTLNKENYPPEEIPTLKDVEQETKRCEIIGLYTSLCELPIVALEKSQGFDCNTFGQPEKMHELRVLMYDNPRVKKTLEYTLKYFEEVNIL